MLHANLLTFSWNECLHGEIWPAVPVMELGRADNDSNFSWQSLQVLKLSVEMRLRAVPDLLINYLKIQSQLFHVDVLQRFLQTYLISCARCMLLSFLS